MNAEQKPILTWENLKSADLSAAIVGIINSQTGSTKYKDLPAKPPFELSGLPPGDYTVCIAGKGSADSKQATQMSNMAKFSVK